MPSRENSRNKKNNLCYVFDIAEVVVLGILTACNAPDVPTGLATILVPSIPVVLRVHNAKVKETENAEYRAQVAERLKALEAAIKQ